MKFASLILVALLAACAGQTTEPNHYLLRSSHQLDSRTLSPSSEFSVGRVEIASYIDQPGLVLETEDGKIRSARNHLWAEPVYEGIRNYLMVNLAQARGEDILPSSLAKTPVVIDIHIDQLHGTNNGKARLVAYWWLRQGGELASAHRFTGEKPLVDNGYSALVDAEKTLLTRLANDIAASLSVPGN